MNYLQERYQRQLILDGFGPAAQEKLARARVLVIGAGGLGCPILQYLAAAGVGTIGIADGDLVSATNLNRQVLYTENDIGKPKAAVASKQIAAFNQEITVLTYPVRWNQQLSIEQFPFYDIIVDATDNFASRYLINDGCVLLNKPLVFGAVSKYEGQVAVFNIVDHSPAINYRDLFPEPPKNNEVLSCSEAGVLGVVPGIIGTMQAAEVIKLITGIGKPLIHRLCNYQVLTQESYTVELSKDPESNRKTPATIEDYLKTDYEWLCAVTVNEISLEDWLNRKDDFVLIDVREPNELPKLNGFIHQSIPLSQLHNEIAFSKEKPIVFVCQSGARSKTAASRITHRITYSLAGGVNEFIKRKLV